MGSIVISYNNIQGFTGASTTHLQIWRAAIYCGTLWLPFPPSTTLFGFFSVFFTRFGLAGLYGWMFGGTRRSQGLRSRYFEDPEKSPPTYLYMVALDELYYTNAAFQIHVHIFDEFLVFFICES